MSHRRLGFKDHARDLDANRYVYAVVSRRARGLSVGVNLNPDKVCNFDCPYCQVDRSTPGGPPDVDVDRLAGELDALLAEIASGAAWLRAPFDTVAPPMRRAVDIAVAGDGEPTTPPVFPGAAAAVRAVRDRRAPALPSRLLTNATLFHKPRVREALGSFDELWCKLDAGTEDYFQRVDGTRLPFARILENLLSVARERPIVLQSMFVTFDGVGPSTAEVDAYLGRIRDLTLAGGRIDRVQVYTIARPPADPRVGALPRTALAGIAERVKSLGIATEIHSSDEEES
jgi:wyosine [tRNA(Phe)-imidazoG37] synthetase (radical SAM superfamily)